jgi:thioesterase domain-containing protein
LLAHQNFLYIILLAWLLFSSFVLTKLTCSRIAVGKYVPKLEQSYHGEMVLFLTEYRSKFGLFRYQYWQKLTTEKIKIHIISGNHSSMLQEPDIKILGEKMKLVLENSDR